MGQGLQRAFAAAEKTRPLTPRQAQMFSEMEPGRWYGMFELYRITGQIGLYENAAKHANALVRRGFLEKRKMGEPQWMRPVRSDPA